MISATKKWLFLKISGALLVPLMIWFILNFVAIYNQGYFELVNFFSKGISGFIFSIFIIIAFFFSAISISEVFEDYISNEKTKYVANRLLYISAIIIPLLTIIILLNLK